MFVCLFTVGGGGGGVGVGGWREGMGGGTLVKTLMSETQYRCSVWELFSLKPPCMLADCQGLPESKEEERERST